MADKFGESSGDAGQITGRAGGSAGVLSEPQTADGVQKLCASGEWAERCAGGMPR